MTNPLAQSAVNPTSSQQSATSSIYGTRFDPDAKPFYIGGVATKLGPFIGGLHNSSGSGEFIQNDELYELTNMEVDTDGSLVNRPQINLFTTTGITNTDNWSFIGTYLPSDGRKFIVAYLPTLHRVMCVDAATGQIGGGGAAYHDGIDTVCCIQYGNKLWVVAQNASTGGGGYFDAPTPTSITWTAVATMQRGEAVAQYRERIWVACGIGATSNTSRFSFSAAGDPSSWTSTDFVDVAPGNGQKLVSLVRLGNDLILFKEHSTHRFTYTTDPRKAELNEVDATVGVPAINCVVVYNNNTIYSLHDNAVYELFQYTYNRISTSINMEQVSDLDLFSKDQYGLTIHRDRLFVRYFKNLYVFSLRVKRWSSWVSTLKFSKVVVIPSATVGLDTAYTTTASQSKPTEAYYFKDIRTTDDVGAVGSTIEVFQGKLTTKTYDFDAPHTFKVIFWWGIAVATSGKFSTSLIIPNARKNMTYSEAKTQYSTWSAAANAKQAWASNTPVIIAETVLPTLGRYARKFIKLLKKVRFRQVYFTISFDVISNGGIADASLRIYDLTVFIKHKEGVVKETS